MGRGRGRNAKNSYPIHVHCHCNRSVDSVTPFPFPLPPSHRDSHFPRGSFFDRVWPPVNGFTFSCWVCVERWGLDMHPVRLLTAFSPSEPDCNLLCIEVRGNVLPRETALLQNTHTHPSLQNAMALKAHCYTAIPQLTLLHTHNMQATLLTLHLTSFIDPVSS